MISIFYPPYAFGGDSIYLHRLCTELTRQGHEVEIIHCADSYHLFRKTVDPSAFPTTEGIEVHRLESRFGSLAPLLSHQLGAPALTGGKIRRLLESKRFDVIHYHNISLFGPKTLEITPPYDAVRLYTAHDHWLVCPMSVLWKNGSYACDKPECISCTLRSRRPPQWWRYTGLIERATRNVDRFLAPSRFCADMHRKRGFTRPMAVLNYFLEPPEDQPKSSGSPHDKPYYLFVGRLERYKGVQDLIEAFRGPGDFDLVVVGSGDYEDELRRQAAGLSRVRFAGWVNQEGIGAYYRRALAVLVPSQTYETFGIVVIEAHAQGAPVIVRDLGPLPEIVADGGGGLVFSTVEELRAHMERLASDEDLRARLSRNGREAFQRRWTPAAHLERYFSIIESARTEEIPAS